MEVLAFSQTTASYPTESAEQTAKSTQVEEENYFLDEVSSTEDDINVEDETSLADDTLDEEDDNLTQLLDALSAGNYSTLSDKEKVLTVAATGTVMAVTAMTGGLATAPMLFGALAFGVFNTTINGYVKSHDN